YGHQPDLARARCAWSPARGGPMRPCVLALALMTAALPLDACNGTAANTQSGSSGAAAGKDAVKRASFGTLPGGAAVEIFTLTNGRGMEVRTIPYGAIVVSIKVPDRAGQFADVV